MGAAELYESEADEASQPAPGSLSVTPHAVEVRRNGGLAAALGAIASALAIAYLARAVGGGGVLDGALALVMGLLGSYWLLTFVDARTPLLVADAQGVRIRLGHNWRGLPWSAVRHVEHTPRRGLLADGRLVVHARNEEKLLAELDVSGRRRAALSTRLHGAPFALPLGLSTRVVGAGADLGAALDRVADQTGAVNVIDTDEPDLSETQPADMGDDPRARPLWRDPRPLLAAGIARLAALSTERRKVDDDAAGAQEERGVGGLVEEEQSAPETEAIRASATPSPLRVSSVGRRSEVRKDLIEELPIEEEELNGRELRRPGSVSLVEDTQVWGDRVRPISRPGDAVDPIVLDDFDVEPALDPVIGPDLLAARTRLGLSVDQLETFYAKGDPKVLGWTFKGRATIA